MTMEKNNDLLDYEGLRDDYIKLTEKIESQSKVSDQLIGEIMKSKLSRTEVWYRRRLAIPLVILALSVSFLILGFNKWYVALVILTGVFEFVADWICFRKLGLRDLMEQDMKTASERVIAHKKARRVADIVEILPALPMLAWTIYIASGNRWDVSMIALFAAFMIFGLLRGAVAARQRGRELEDFIKILGSLDNQTA